MLGAWPGILALCAPGMQPYRSGPPRPLPISSVNNQAGKEHSSLTALYANQLGTSANASALPPSPWKILCSLHGCSWLIVFQLMVTEVQGCW